MVYKLWEHQQRAVDFANENKDIAMFYDTGTGKTGSAINILRHRLNDNKRYMRVLILGPIAILRQFKNEFPLFSKMDTRKVHAITEKGKKRVATVQKVIDFDPNQVMIINYEALLNEEIHKSLVAWQPEIIICDESHMLKNHKSKRFKAVKKLSDKAAHTYIMTGSPIAVNTMDLFAQYAILDGGTTFGTNYFVFRNKYFRDKNASWAGRANHFPEWVPREEMETELNDLVYKKAVRADKHECLDLPDFLEKEHRVVLAGDQAKAYKEMERDFIAFLKSKHEQPLAVVAELAVTKAMKLAQITGGFLYDEEKVPHYFKSNPKLAELQEILEQVTHNNKALVWCNFRPEIKLISNLLKKMGIKYVSIDGSVSATNKADAQEAFQNDPDTRVIVGNSAMATGLNLQAGGYSIYYSRAHSYIINEQAKGRNFRGGSVDLHKKITSIDIIVDDSIDDKKLDAIRTKKKISDVVLTWGDK